MRRFLQVTLLPLLLLPCTVNAKTCEESLIQADVSPKDGYLSLAEFETFCNLEAKETPLLLEQAIFHQVELPPQLIKIYKELSDGENGINIEGIASPDKSLQSFVNVICVKTREAMAKMLVEAQEVKSFGMGPFAGEAASSGLHQGNKLLSRQGPATTDTDVPPEDIQLPPDLSEGGIPDVGEGGLPGEIPTDLGDGASTDMGDGELPEGSPSEISQSGLGGSTEAVSRNFPEVPMTLTYELGIQEETGLGTFSAVVEYEGQGWVGFGISAEGKMQGSLAIIGLPDQPISDTNPGKYFLGAYSVDQVTLTSQQTLLAADIVQNDTHTVLSFTKLLTEPDEIAINPTGQNNFLVAGGSSNQLNYHAHRHSFSETIELPVGIPSEISQSGPGDATGGPPGLGEDGPPGLPVNGTLGEDERPPPTPNADDTAVDSTFCEEQNATLSLCIEENICETCEDDIGELEEPIAPDITSIAPIEDLDYNLVVIAMNDYLEQVCAYQRRALCQLKTCCPACSTALDDVFQCSLADAEAEITTALEEMSTILAQYNDATTMETPIDEQLELIFDCFLDVCEGDGAAEGDGPDGPGGPGEDMGQQPEPEGPIEGGGLALDQCPDEVAAYRGCLEANTCQNCMSKIGQAPEQPAYFGASDGLPPYNEIVGHVNEHLAMQCSYFQYTICSLHDCCETCEAELEAWFACLNDVPLDVQQQGIEEAYLLLGSGEPVPEDAAELIYECDLFSLNCTEVTPPPFFADIETPSEGGMVGDAIAAVRVNVAVLIASTEGLSAEEIKGEYSGMFMVAFDATLGSEDFFTTVLGSLSSDAAMDEGAAGAACPDRENATAVARQGGQGMMNDGNFTAGCPGSLGGESGPQMPPEMGGMGDGGLLEGSGVEGLPGMEGGPPEDIPPEMGEGEDPTDGEEPPTPMLPACPPAQMECPDGKLVDNQNPDCVMPDCPNGEEETPGEGQGQLEGNPSEMGGGDAPNAGAPGGQPERRHRRLKGTFRTLQALRSSVELYGAEITDIVDADCPPETDPAYTCQIVHGSYTAQTDGTIDLERLALALRLATDEWINEGGFETSMPADSPFLILETAPPREGEGPGASVGVTQEPSEGSTGNQDLGEEPEAEMPSAGQGQPLPDAESGEEPTVATSDTEDDADNAGGPGGPDTSVGDGEDEEMGGNFTSTDEKPGGSIVMMEKPILVNSSFVLSSPDGKTAVELKANLDSEEVQALLAAFMNFVNDVAAELGAEVASEDGQLSSETGTPPTRERYLRVQTKVANVLSRIQKRRLSVTYDAESAELYDFQDTTCNDETAAVSKQTEEAVASPNNCIAVFGKYRIIVGPEDDVEEIYNTYVGATQTSIEEGKLEEEVQATATIQNITIPFVVEGVSPIVDTSFDAFEEIETETDAEGDSMLEDVSTDDGNVTTAPVATVNANDTTANATNTNATASETSAAPRSTTRAFVALLAGMIATFGLV